jgi:hypothetical protein
MRLRALSAYLAGTMVLLAVISLIHRHVGGLAPAPPVDVSNVPISIAPIPLPAETVPTILHSQSDDGELPHELRDAIARRPESTDPSVPDSTAPKRLSDLPPDDALLTPVPEG